MVHPSIHPCFHHAHVGEIFIRDHPCGIGYCITEVTEDTPHHFAMVPVLGAISNHPTHGPFMCFFRLSEAVSFAMFDLNIEPDVIVWRH